VTRARSPNVRRVRLTAAVLGIELEEKKLDFAKTAAVASPSSA
jgi:hypothetical protein